MRVNGEVTSAYGVEHYTPLTSGFDFNLQFTRLTTRWSARPAFHAARQKEVAMRSDITI